MSYNRNSDEVFNKKLTVSNPLEHVVSSEMREIMKKPLEKCPACKELLVFPRGTHCYCEDCGWPEEDYAEEFSYPEDGDQLGDLQPFLEFFDGDKWVNSGVKFSTMRNNQFRGLYRYPFGNPC
jgi:hypothetical protein